MAIINLRDVFPNEELDCFIEVPDGGEEAFKSALTKELAKVYFKEQRKENKYSRQLYRYKAHYSLDKDDGIENDIICDSDDPVFDEFTDKLDKQLLLEAINSLPGKQSDRIYPHFILSISKAEIARKEGVNESKVRKAIERGIEGIKKYLKNFFE